MVFKLDIAKAYDCLEWHFLLCTMKVFGFSPQSQDMVYRIISNIWYQFRINGEIIWKFRSFRCVRQGDPLSHLLFALAQQVISANLKWLIHNGSNARYNTDRNNLSISHLFYADYVLFSLTTLISL